MATQTLDYQLKEEAPGCLGQKLCYFHCCASGMKVYICYSDRPMVKGDFIFATDTHSDYGIPHAIQHLVYVGSERIPYKGVVDLMSNKCFGSGTNAYTKVDHTCFNIRTAGSIGFLNVLPHYLDHLFFPTLTHEAFLTEIHHVTARGEDGGVLYSEILDSEYQCEKMCLLELNRNLYADTNYRSDTKGLLNHVRSKLNTTLVRDYHQKYYVPSNLALIITGPVKPDEVLKVVNEYEKRLVEKKLVERKLDRPWQAPVPPLETCVVRYVDFPSDSDTDCSIYLGFRGPSIIQGYQERIAIHLLLQYLTWGPVSPFQAEFTEPLTPWCSSVSFSIQFLQVTSFIFSFHNVHRKFTAAFPETVLEVLRRVSATHKTFNMHRMKDIIEKWERKYLKLSEDDPHKLVMKAARVHFLYGNDDDKKLPPLFDVRSTLRVLKTKGPEYWVQMVEEYMSGFDVKHVCVIGEPSTRLRLSMEKDEEERLADQRRALVGRQHDISANLERAIHINSTPVPKSVMQLVPPLSVDQLKFYPIRQLAPREDKLPIRICYDRVETNFVTIYLGIDTSRSLTLEDRFYLPMMADLFLSSPIFRSGSFVSHEEVVARLFSDTQSTKVGIPLTKDMPSSNIFFFCFELIPEQYEGGVKLISNVLFNTQFDSDRISATANKFYGDLSKLHTSGLILSRTLMSSLLYGEGDNYYASNLFRQQEFVVWMLEKLRTHPLELEEKFDKVRNLIAKPSNLFAHVTIGFDNLLKEDDVLRPWKTFLPPKMKSSEKFLLKNIVQTHKNVKIDPCQDAFLIAGGSVGGQYMVLSAPMFTDPHHDDLPALYVLTSYLFQSEGVIFRALRCQNLAYNYDFKIKVHEGLLIFEIHRSTNIALAYKEIKKIVFDHLDGKTPFEDSLLVPAKSTLVYPFMDTEKSPTERSLRSLVGYLSGVSINYMKEMICYITQVKEADMRSVGNKYVKGLFEGDKRRITVSCHTGSIRRVTSDMEDLGCKLSRVSMTTPEILKLPEFEL